MGGMGIHFDLAEAKLAPPPTRPGAVAKADVIRRLSVSRSAFATVVAPAGYGKTTLVAHWAELDERQFAWVSLDARDDDAVVFMRYIAAAVDRIEPMTPDVVHALSGPGRAGWTTRVPPLGNALASLDRPIVLVLDDLHSVGDRSSLDVLAALYQYVPMGSTIAITSRETPELPLPRWRAQGRLDEIGVSDLRLDKDEARMLLDAAGTELGPDELADLTERVEGWPAGLYLAALSLRAGGTGSTGAGEFTGDDRFVSEYFRHELLSLLPPDEARFLERTSVLERMSGSLCDSVLETTGSAQMLESLERKNGFVVPLDRRGEWYRYHHLFGQLLRNELERSDPDAVSGLAARAMTWCLEHGRAEDAVVYGYVAGDTAAIAGLVDALALPLYYDGRLATIEEWLGWFSDDELRLYPALAIYGAWLRVLTGRADDAERWLALADGAISAIPLSDGSATIEPWVATLRASMMRDGALQSLADAELALDQLHPDSTWRSTALMLRGVARFLLGETDRAAADLEAAVESGLAIGAVEEVYTSQAQLSLLAARQGAWKEAGERAQAAQAYADGAGMGGYPTSAIAHVAVARVALHEARHEDARAALTRVHRLRPMLDEGVPWLTVEVGLELTRAHLAFADVVAARTVFAETERVLALRPGMDALVADAAEVRELLSATAGSTGAWAMSLTGAELRLLPYLATHLTFPEIADRLFLSRNTVKTEAVSIYRKLGAGSRSQAVDRAVEVGLIESMLVQLRTNLTQIR